MKELIDLIGSLNFIYLSTWIVPNLPKLSREDEDLSYKITKISKFNTILISFNDCEILQRKRVPTDLVEYIGFIDTLKKHLKEENKVLLENNLSDLEILIKSKGERKPAGSYTCTNKIKIAKRFRKYESVIGHELIHAASSKFNKNGTIWMSGFSLFCIEDNEEIFDLGNGLNEGYTELLTSRIFTIELKKVYINIT